MQQAAKQGSQLIATGRISQADLCLSNVFDQFEVFNIFDMRLFYSKVLVLLNAEESVHLPCVLACVFEACCSRDEPTGTAMP